MIIDGLIELIHIKIINCYPICSEGYSYFILNTSCTFKELCIQFYCLYFKLIKKYLWIVFIRFIQHSQIKTHMSFFLQITGLHSSFSSKQKILNIKFTCIKIIAKILFFMCLFQSLIKQYLLLPKPKRHKKTSWKK